MIIANKNYDEASVFTPENLLREARRQKNIPEGRVPAVCVLDPDGDLVAYLIRKNQATLNAYWGCYHTKMYDVHYDRVDFGIIGCAVGAPFAVLIAEQLFVSGCKLLISITSSGIIHPPQNGAKFILIEEALRDEGTSHHYIAPDKKSAIHPLLAKSLLTHFENADLKISIGKSWTTDAPYRETPSAIDYAKLSGVHCVEMEAAALYAFSEVKRKDVICYARLTNTMARTEGDFEKGEEMGSLDDLELIRHTINATMKNRRYHWDHIYDTKSPNEVSWTQDIPLTSLELIRTLSLPKNARIIDVGGGDSRLVDYLLSEGYEDITVLDISERALEKAKERLGKNADRVRWIVSDITEFKPDNVYDLWHDRATFHFLLSPEQVAAYVGLVNRWVKGYLVVGTFSTDGPLKCSGLDIRQYDEDSMTRTFENSFEKMECFTVDHDTPFSTRQNFLFCSFKKRATPLP